VSQVRILLGAHTAGGANHAEHSPRADGRRSRTRPRLIALVGYTVRNIAWFDPAIALPILVSGAITAGLQLWRSNLVLSLAGTTMHVVLATTIAGGLVG
jgi:hypothetical protein